jgi:hypothetical protein
LPQKSADGQKTLASLVFAAVILGVGVVAAVRSRLIQADRIWDRRSFLVAELPGGSVPPRTIRSTLRTLGLGLLAMLPALSPASASIYVAGDSLGVGVHLASRAPSVATESVRIMSKAPISQIASVPEGSTLFLSLGTNDAVGGVPKVQKSVDAILSAAAARNIRVIWLGPPCVFQTWDDSARALDTVLAGIMAQEGVTYVSMRDDALCARSLRAGDGVHFTMKGYRMMWDRAIAASGEADTAPALPQAAAGKRRAQIAAVAPVPLPVPSFRTGAPVYYPGGVLPAPLPAFHRPQA